VILALRASVEYTFVEELLIVNKTCPQKVSSPAAPILDGLKLSGDIQEGGGAQSP